MGYVKNITDSGSGALQKWALLGVFCLISGCALFPPPPAECQGQFRPVNASPEKNADVDMPLADSNTANKSGRLEKTLGTSEGAIDGK